MTELEERIVAVLVALGEGEVVSYGDVAHDAGFPGRARAVGSLLAATDLDLPWWRVVRSDGRLATDPASGQAAVRRTSAARSTAQGTMRARTPVARMSSSAAAAPSAISRRNSSSLAMNITWRLKATPPTWRARRRSSTSSWD